MANTPLIGGLFQTPAAPKPGQAPAIADPTKDPATQKEMADAQRRQREAASGGAASDILTGGSGLGAGSQKTSSNVLLGS